MSDQRSTVLFAGSDIQTYGQMADAVRAQGIDAVHAPWNNLVFDLVYANRFDVIVAGYPVPGADFGRFLSAVRSQGSPCRGAGLILVAARGTVEDATLLIGRGVNRVLSEQSPFAVLFDTLKELMSVAPRVPLQTPARIRAEAERGPQNAVYQTENLSTSGMLLRGWSNLPVGMEFDFELSIPDQDEPVRGRATVTRIIDTGREKHAGIGARFDSFVESDDERFASFLGQQSH